MDPKKFCSPFNDDNFIEFVPPNDVPFDEDGPEIF